MKGYHRNRRATKNTVKEGWLHTGDVARYREDGQFIIVDRLKELIKVKGHQVNYQSFLSYVIGDRDVSTLKDRCSISSVYWETSGKLYCNTSLLLN